MSASVLILRAQPGADATAARAKRRGLNPLVAPIFEVRPLPWQTPDPTRFDAVLLTSANAARHGGPELDALTDLPCFAVGSATAEAAASAGFKEVQTGASDGAELLPLLAEAGVSRALHLCGREHIALEHPQVTLVRLPVYASDPLDALPLTAIEAIDGGALILLHSPRSASCFGRHFDQAGLNRESAIIAAISEAARAAAGPGWKAAASAPEPRDDALLELAAKLCQTYASGQLGTEG